MRTKKYTEEERIAAIRATKRKYQSKYRNKNPESNRVWKENNKDRIKEYGKNYSEERRKKDAIYKFSMNLRNMIRHSFKRVNSIKPLKTEELLGCTITEFQNYILSKAPQGITLENFNMYEYHIDHIIPLSTAKTIEEVIKLCHYTNLQPLWCIDNIKKSNKVEY